MSDQQSHGNPEPEAVMQSRRRLLQAAAAAAPMIATLPNGAMAATASTAQCIVDSRDDSQATAADVVSDPRPTGDAFVRANGEAVNFNRRVGQVSQNVTVYTIAPDSKKYYYSNGNPFVPTGWTETSREPVLLMRVFVPTSDSGDVIDDPTSVDDCLTTSTHPLCIFPVSKREPSNDAGNMGIAQSCLCSVNPNLLPPGAC